MDNSMLDDLALRHRALGAVIGSAVGDALGAPFEFGKPCEYSKRFPRPVLGGTGEMIGNQVWEPGEFTDDTQMAIVQAESILARDGIDGADLFKRFRVWAADAKDVGAQTRAGPRITSPVERVGTVLLSAQPEQERRERIADARDADGGAICRGVSGRDG